MVFDTDILIWFFRGEEQAAKAIEKETTRKISTISYLELLQGAVNKQEIKKIRDFLSEFLFEIITLSENIGHRATIYMEQYSLSINICLADALIASSVVENNEILYSGNIKHFKVFPELKLKRFTI